MSISICKYQLQWPIDVSLIVLISVHDDWFLNGMMKETVQGY